MSSDDFSFPLKLDGTFANGKIVDGNGYRPSCSTKRGCIYGAVGEFKDGKLYSGRESIVFENDKTIVIE